VVPQSKFNTFRPDFHGLFDRLPRANPIIRAAAAANTVPELEAANDRRDTSQHIQRISNGGRFPWLRSLN
jgi:hypothetical protein